MTSATGAAGRYIMEKNHYVPKAELGKLIKIANEFTPLYEAHILQGRYVVKLERENMELRAAIKKSDQRVTETQHRLQDAGKTISRLRAQLTVAHRHYAMHYLVHSQSSAMEKSFNK